ncbi:MAG: hypothetical protein K9G41_10980 [Flavobacteriales bacterium]|nr:hypothetical protein [Flavobacteriales bacterium]
MRALLLVSICLLAMQTKAQNWRDMIGNPNANFRDVQAAFYSEFGDEVGKKGSGWKQFKRWEWFMEQRLSESGKMPNPKLIYEEVKRADLQKQFRGANGDWQLVGPIEEPTNGSGRSIGRISAIAFHPTDTNQIWAGAPSGGLWKSEDNGQSWEPLTDNLLNIGVAELVINPHHPDTMYLASGDGSTGDTYSYGVMISVDGGQSWDTTGLSFGVNEGRNIRRMILDSTNTNVLIAASTNGIYRTQDAGTTWQLVQSGNFCDVEFKPYSHDTVYATTSSLSSPPIYVSHDNGLSWAPSVNGMNIAGMGRCKVAVTKAAPDMVYLLATNSASSYQGLYRSTDAGANWTLMSDSPNILGYSEFGSDEDGQGWYSMELAVSPINPNEVRVGGINTWKSNDGGTSFLIESHWYGANGSYIHADQHRAEYHPITNQFYAGNDGGLYKRSYIFNGYESICSGMSITQFYRLGNAASDPTIILAGAQDNGTFRWKNNIWAGVNGGDGMEAMIHPTNPFIMYATIQNGELHKSTDGGVTFGDDIAPVPGAWVTPFMMEPGDPQVIYSASGSKVYRSEDAGSTWFEFSPALTTVNSGQLIMLDVATSNTEYVVAGSSRTIRITKDLGGTWTNILNGLASNNMTYVAFDPLDEETIWVTFSGYTDARKVYRSHNAGQTWENMSMNLPNLPVNCIEIERSSTGGVYVGTDVGVYYWDSTLSEWEPYMTGLPNVIVNELEIHEATHTIRAATYGRGIWETDTRNTINVGIEETKPASSILSVWPNPASDFVQIEFPQDVKPENLILIDAYGRTVRESLNPNLQNQLRIGIQGLADAVYYIASAKDRRLVGRFIVSRP